MSWVSGPEAMTGPRRFNVTEGTSVVLLVNGKAQDKVYKAGRNGGLVNLFSEDRNVPQFGDLSLLTFRHAVDVNHRAHADVRLADGSMITVEADFEVRPEWKANDSLLLTWIRRYGANPATIEQAAERALDSDFESIVRASLNHLTHDQVQAAPDKRSLLKVFPQPSGLLAIDHLLRVTCTEDPHVREVRDLQHSIMVDKARAEAEEIRFRLGQRLEFMRASHANDIDRVRAEGELDLGKLRTLGEVAINQALAAAYGISPADVAYPGVYQDRQKVIAEAVRSVLTENADILPLLVELSNGNPAQFLTAMFESASSRGASSRGATGTPSDGDHHQPAPVNHVQLDTHPAARSIPWTLEPSTARCLEQAGISELVLGSAVIEGPHGPQRVAVLASGGDRRVGTIDDPDGLKAIVVRQRDSVEDTVLRLLHAAAQWCDYSLRFTPPNVIQDQNRNRALVQIDIDQASPLNAPARPHAPLALAAWISAINALGMSTTPEVTVSIMGKR